MDGKKVERRKKKRKEEDELNSSWRKSGGWPFPLGVPWVLRTMQNTMTSKRRGARILLCIVQWVIEHEMGEMGIIRW